MFLYERNSKDILGNVHQKTKIHLPVNIRFTGCHLQPSNE